MPSTPILQLPYPSSSDTADVPRDIQALANKIDPLGVVPVGAMMMWLTAVAPSGWLFMLGQQVDALVYPGLAAVLGQSGGLVTIPDMANRFPSGAGTVAVGQGAGANSLTLTARQSGIRAHDHGGLTGAHNHPYTDPGHTHGIVGERNTGGGFAMTNLAANAVAFATNTQNAQTGISIGNAQASIPTQAENAALDPIDNRPLLRAVNFIIRAG